MTKKIIKDEYVIEFDEGEKLSKEQLSEIVDKAIRFAAKQDKKDSLNDAKILLHRDGSEVKEGDEVIDFRGDKATVEYWEAPKEKGKSGRVYVKHEGEDGSSFSHGYYPEVFGLKWKENVDDVFVEDKVSEEELRDLIGSAMILKKNHPEDEDGMIVELVFRLHDIGPGAYSPEDMGKIEEALKKALKDAASLEDAQPVSEEGSKLLDLLGESYIRRLGNDMIGLNDDDMPAGEIAKAVFDFCKDHNYGLEEFVTKIDPDYKAKTCETDGDTIVYRVNGSGDDLKDFLAPLIDIYKPGYKLRLSNRQTGNSFVRKNANVSAEDAKVKDVPLNSPEENVQITYTEKLKGGKSALTYGMIEEAFKQRAKDDGKTFEAYLDVAIESLKDDITNAKYIVSGEMKSTRRLLLEDYVKIERLAAKAGLDSKVAEMKPLIDELSDKLNLNYWKQPKFKKSQMKSASQELRSKHRYDSSIAKRVEPVFLCSESDLKASYNDAKQGKLPQVFEANLTKVEKDMSADYDRINQGRDNYLDDPRIVQVLPKIVEYYELAKKLAEDLGYEDVSERFGIMLTTIKKGWGLE